MMKELHKSVNTMMTRWCPRRFNIGFGAFERLVVLIETLVK